ncbi:DUF932 domain-containing protein [Donghicola sp.]|jgi:hypothetical protein|uniref:DUF932 domain-containing protein n=1 Tax=Donghicola sp. TaxID=1929294 RepID=UPI0025DE5D05|nr:DUF932 domain-containing protein [Donghicola sp.]MCT4579133.1 DUF932 domain-containing protein [Donghicola sp.]
MAFDALDEIYGLRTWKGLPLADGFIRKVVPAADLRGALPEFARRPFGTEPNNHPRMRSIWRMPFGDDPCERPVAVVSDQYDLLQHQVLATWLTENLSKAGLKNADAEITMTEYGERVRITVPLVDRTFDFAEDLLSPDRYRPEIEVTNSVDRSSAFHVVLRWRRLICLNGMFTVEEDRMRSIHRVDLSRTELVRDFIRERLSTTPDMVTALSSWKKRKTDKQTVQAWCEEWLRNQKDWTVENCARLWWILEQGYDGEVRTPSGKKEKWPLRSYQVSQDARVPGDNFPVKTAYDVAQLLTWITSNQRSVEMQLEGTEAVPKLMKAFLKFAGARK